MHRLLPYLTVHPSLWMEHAHNWISAVTYMLCIEKCQKLRCQRFVGKTKGHINPLSACFPLTFWNFRILPKLLSSAFFIQKNDGEQTSGAIRSYEPAKEKPEDELTALVTSISWTFSKDVRSKKASFPFPSSFFTDVPVIRSLSSGLKQQSVLRGKYKHQQFKIPNKFPSNQELYWT